MRIFACLAAVLTLSLAPLAQAQERTTLLIEELPAQRDGVRMVMIRFPTPVVGNDASWAQIARDQVGLLGDDVGTVLRRTDYHDVARAFGGEGLLLDDASKVDEVLARAQALARAGKPVLVNVHLSASEFRKGSISM